MKGIAEITRDCLALPRTQRLKIARILLDVSGAPSEFDPDAETAWEAEIAERLEAVRNGTAASKAANEVFSELDRRFPS